MEYFTLSGLKNRMFLEKKFHKFLYRHGDLILTLVKYANSVLKKENNKCGSII